MASGIISLAKLLTLVSLFCNVLSSGLIVCSPSKLKDFEGVVDDHAWRGALPQYDPVSELLQLRRILAGAAEGLRFRYGRCLRLNRSPTCLEHTLLTGIANLFGIDLAPFIQWREHLLIRGRALSISQQQKAGWIQGVVQGRDNLFL